MRIVAGLTVLFLLALVTVSPMAALAQQTIERPNYTPGDFWRYEVLLGEIPSFNETEDIVLDIDVTGTYTVTIDGLEELDIDGEATMAYDVSRSFELAVEGVVEIPLEGFPINASVSGNVTVTDSSYMAQEGLEVLTMDTSAELDITLTTEFEGIEASLSLTGTATSELAFDYVTNTWSFPYELGNEGTQESLATGTTYFQLTFFDNTTQSSEDVSANVTYTHEAVREETVTVGAGTFSTLVVNTTVAPEGDDLPLEVSLISGSQLSYWSSQVGAPVKQEILDDSGDVILELNLISLKYQVAERLSILGVDIVYWIAIIAVVAGVVVLVVVLRIRRRPPEVEQQPPLGPP